MTKSRGCFDWARVCLKLRHFNSGGACIVWESWGGTSTFCACTSAKLCLHTTGVCRNYSEKKLSVITRPASCKHLLCLHIVPVRKRRIWPTGCLKSHATRSFPLTFLISVAQLSPACARMGKPPPPHSSALYRFGLTCLDLKLVQVFWKHFLALWKSPC